MTKKIICALLCLAMLFCMAACGGDKTDTASKASSGAASKGATSQAEVKNDYPHPTTESPWVPVPMVSQKQLDAGLAGGEGCQWPTYISFDSTDGSLAFLGIDVGGMYRSTDGGKTWSPATVGISAHASTGAEIDPKNNNRVLCVGCDSHDAADHGVYLSTDKGESWKIVCPQKTVGHRDYRHQISYDESSFDEKLGYCKVAYYLRESKKYGDTPALAPALFKTTDGGETWSEVCSDKNMGNGNIYVNPKNGWVYIQNTSGVLRSKDGGKTFSSIYKGDCYGICVINTKPNNVYISAKEGLMISTNSGDSFAKQNESGFPTQFPSRISVSRANPNNMMVQDDLLLYKGEYTSKNYFSNDGGKTWTQSVTDSSMSYIPYNVRSTVFAWHPTDANVCISTGGDMVMRSTDGGKKFTYSATGYNGACCTGIFFNVNNPDYVISTNQDYNGGYSYDGGKTWNYINWSKQNYGGFTYGAYMLTKDILVAIEKSGEILRTTDGGKTVVKTGVKNGGAKVGCGWVGHENVVFIGNQRSDDYGETWTTMTDCQKVCTCAKDGTLYGVKDSFFAVKSTDGGLTWTVIAINEKLQQVLYDECNKRVLALCGNTVQIVGDGQKLTPYTTIKVNGKGVSCNSFAIDPRNGNLYAASNSDVNSVVRTIDGGKTWQCVSRSLNDGSVGPDGAKFCSNMVYNVKANEVWCTSACRGMWKIAAKA